MLVFVMSNVRRGSATNAAGPERRGMSDAPQVVMSHSVAVALLVVVGSTSYVSPAPVRAEPGERVRYNDKEHRVPTPAASSDGWVELASATPASNGREYITIDANAGAFTSLRIDADAGRPFVDSLRIDYKDGTHRIVQLGERLDAKKRRSAVVDLRGAHEIDSLVVVSDRDSKGSYAILGMADKPPVASR